MARGLVVRVGLVVCVSYVECIGVMRVEAAVRIARYCSRPRDMGTVGWVDGMG